MRWFLGLLVLVNVGILIWGSLDEDRPAEPGLASPGVGSIRLLGENEAAQPPAAVPIPAPPRSDGVMPESSTATAIPVPPAVVAQPVPAQAVEATAAEQAVSEVAAPTESVAEPEVQPAAGPVAAEAVKVEPEVQPKPRFCSHIGPFTNTAATQVLADYLKGRGGQVEVREETRSMHTGYWVMVPPQKSRAAAEDVAEQLKAKGIKDYWIIPKGEYQFAISLGVFSQKRNAVSFAGRAEKKGFQVDIRDKRKERTAVWLTYQGVEFVPPMEIRARVSEGVSAEDQDCP